MSGGAWSRPPVGRIVRQAELGALGANLGENNGESRRVCRLQKYSDWIFKEYPKPVPLVGVRRLDRLIQLPKQMTAADKALVDAHTSWPASRVLDVGQKTIGVLMPLAPSGFSTSRQLPSGRSGPRVLEVDVLALTEAQQKQLKLPPQSLADRLSVCASIAAVAALFERQGLVYLDWSYANVFWSLDDHSAYVIDLDGCSFGPRPQIHSHNWEDPQVPLGQQAGNESDRYRVALLIARCLTGQRVGMAETRSRLSSLLGRHGTISEVAGVLLRALKDGSPAERPPINEISMALAAAAGTNLRPDASPFSWSTTGSVKTWKPVGTGTGGTLSPKTKAKAKVPPPPPARPTQPARRPTTTPQSTPSLSSFLSQPRNPSGNSPAGPQHVTPARSQYNAPARSPSGGGRVFATVLIVILIIVVLALIL